MTKEEYLQILETSPAFKDLSEDVQSFYKNAKDMKFEEYAGVFLKGQSFREEIQQEFIDKNNQAVDEFKNNTKDAKKDLLVKSEEATQANDEKQGDLLLDKLNNLT